MKVNSVQEHEDKTVSFTGTLTQAEADTLLGFGLNAMVSLGIISMLPSVKVEHVDKQDVH
jgi:hypothetical protein